MVFCPSLNPPSLPQCLAHAATNKGLFNKSTSGLVQSLRIKFYLIKHTLSVINIVTEEEQDTLGAHKRGINPRLRECQELVPKKLGSKLIKTRHCTQ